MKPGWKAFYCWTSDPNFAQLHEALSASDAAEQFMQDNDDEHPYVHGGRTERVNVQERGCEKVTTFEVNGELVPTYSASEAGE